MTKADRYKQALAAITPPTTSEPPARSLAEIDGATHHRPSGQIDNQPITTTGLQGQTRHVKGKTRP